MALQTLSGKSEIEEEIPYVYQITHYMTEQDHKETDSERVLFYSWKWER